MIFSVIFHRIPISSSSPSPVRQPIELEITIVLVLLGLDQIVLPDRDRQDNNSTELRIDILRQKLEI